MSKHNISPLRFEDRVSEVLNSPPSSHPLLERDVRLLHRRVFLDHASRLGNKDFVFWLTLILKPWPTHSQARLLYLLLAPENSQGTVDFSCVRTFRVACVGNLCFGKCGVLHCSVWDVQTINFLYMQHN